MPLEIVRGQSVWVRAGPEARRLDPLSAQEEVFPQVDS